ncbi:hypothetical protein SAMN05216554_3304 [Herbiconiux ginsengi]|uniref:Uncharacterized protein n=1 Tax=Herbiconiux ginsengi TaxID=381665 RepID=A0A1H3S4M2_9MICO|nr:hypothetical protein SAMN05216554_3304 [Herbiconiux ginsengi]
MNVHERFSNRLRRCRHCGIRVPRGKMIYNHRACSEDCADHLWLKDTYGPDFY